jgi:hypothetical protein
MGISLKPKTDHERPFKSLPLANGHWLDAVDQSEPDGRRRTVGFARSAHLDFRRKHLDPKMPDPRSALVSWRQGIEPFKPFRQLSKKTG